MNPLIQKETITAIVYVCAIHKKYNNNFSFKNYSEKMLFFCLPIDELKNKQIIHDVNSDRYAE